MRKDTVCHKGIITSKIRLRQKIKLEFIIHSIHKYVYMRKQIDAAETQAEPSLLSDRKVINTYAKLHQFRSLN